MQKLKILAAILILLSIVITAATVSTTTMSDKPGRLITAVAHQQLDAWHQYLREISRTTGAETQNGWREYFQHCCDQLEHMEEECRYDDVRRIVERRVPPWRDGRDYGKSREPAGVLPHESPEMRCPRRRSALVRRTAYVS